MTRTILFSDNDLNSINTELKEVSNWFKANKLSVNALENKLYDSRYVYNNIQ